MTLRHRLLLVYGIITLLSLGTVGVALFELNRSRLVFGALQYWKDHDLVNSAQNLRDAFPDEAQGDPAAYKKRFNPLYLELLGAGDANVDRPREALNRLNILYSEWMQLPEADRLTHLEKIRRALDSYVLAVEDQLQTFRNAVEDQDTRIRVLPWIVVTITLAYIAILGSLLRRWILHPIQRLTRQVDALGRDRPPPDPLLSTPPELAELAHALDRARQSLGTLRQQLVDSERLTTIGQFAAQIAHNLRNPLASIRAAAQVTSRVDRGETASLERMHDIIASVDRMNQWIVGLMEIARREPTPTKSSDVTPILQRVRDALRPEISAKELDLLLEVPESGLVCAHDPATLEHAIFAMVVNAIEASPLGSRITLKGQYEQNGHGSPRCRIDVEDRGSGLPRDEPERIFEFSYSTKQRGMGLGLALARQALQRQGGSAHAFNNEHGGATVYIELPVNENGRD